MIFQPEMTLFEGVQLTAIAMAIVFILLLAISFLVSLLKYMPGDAKKVEVKKPSIRPITKAVKGVDWAEVEGDEEMLVASLVAGIEASGDKQDTNYKITRITRL